MNSHRVFLRHSGAICGLLAIAIATALALGLRWNSTPSLPLGLYRQVGAEWTKGDLVVVEAPVASPVAREAIERNYFRPAYSRSHFAPLLKRVVAVAGDFVAVGEVIAVNGHEVPNSRILRTDSAGRRLEAHARSGVVSPGTVWVMSDYSRLSYDSRYFGAVPASSIRGRAQPLWTW